MRGHQVSIQSRRLHIRCMRTPSWRCITFGHVVPGKLRVIREPGEECGEQVADAVLGVEHEFPAVHVRLGAAQVEVEVERQQVNVLHALRTLRRELVTHLRPDGRRRVTRYAPRRTAPRYTIRTQGPGHAARFGAPSTIMHRAPCCCFCCFFIREFQTLAKVSIKLTPVVRAVS